MWHQKFHSSHSSPGFGRWRTKDVTHFWLCRDLLLLELHILLTTVTELAIEWCRTKPANPFIIQSISFTPVKPLQLPRGPREAPGTDRLSNQWWVIKFLPLRTPIIIDPKALQSFHHLCARNNITRLKSMVIDHYSC